MLFCVHHVCHGFEQWLSLMVRVTTKKGRRMTAGMDFWGVDVRGTSFGVMCTHSHYHMGPVMSILCGFDTGLVSKYMAKISYFSVKS